MRLSVYLGENEIRTVLGRSGKKIEIMDCLSIRLKEGALINDVVTEELFDYGRKPDYHEGAESSAYASQPDAGTGETGDFRSDSALREGQLRL